jgi:hypothetical protein
MFLPSDFFNLVFLKSLRGSLRNVLIGAESCADSCCHLQSSDTLDRATPNDSVGEEEIGRITFVRLSKSTYRKLALQDKSMSLLATNLAPSGLPVSQSFAP